jgi:uncharacterized alpha-E superfamily protein
MLLSRVADQLYWGARYLERAEDTARLVRSYTEVIIDLPIGLGATWEPLLAVAGSGSAFFRAHDDGAEAEIIHFLVAEASNPGSLVQSVTHARENLRTTREVLPRDAWQAVNDLYLYVTSNHESGVERRGRARFLSRVVADCQRLEGVLASSMSRDEAYEMWMLGQAIERADMTTRVVGVRAASLLALPPSDGRADDYDEVQWMGVLRSLSAMQMYQRATRGPIEGAEVVRFLLRDPHFPRSVASCVGAIRGSLGRLPHSSFTLPGVDAVDDALQQVRPVADDGEALDRAMERVQAALAELSDRVSDAFVRGAA